MFSPSARLARRRDKEAAELYCLTQARQAYEIAALERAATARHHNQPLDYSGTGFEFSNRTFDAYMASLTPLLKQQLLQKALASTAEQAETMPAAGCERSPAILLRLAPTSA